jgi:hypothetical protein
MNELFEPSNKIINISIIITSILIVILIIMLIMPCINKCFTLDTKKTTSISPFITVVKDEKAKKVPDGLTNKYDLSVSRDIELETPHKREITVEVPIVSTIDKIPSSKSILLKNKNSLYTYTN